MKKTNIGYLGLLAIPLAVLGVAGSVAFAEQGTATPAVVAPVASTAVAQSVPAIADTDKETNDDTSAVGSKADTEKVDAPDTNDTDSVAGSKADTEKADAPEKNDDAAGAHEASGKETTD